MRQGIWNVCDSPGLHCHEICKLFNFIICRDYKAEYEKLRLDKLAEKRKSQEQRLDDIKKNVKTGTEVPMSSFITEVSSGRELTEIYLKHPANESSEDEDGTEDVMANGDTEKEEEGFNKFMMEQMQKQKQKIKMSSVAEKTTNK